MRITLLVLVALSLAGCATAPHSRAPVAQVSQHPKVRVQGVDGTVLTGELMNGTVTIESGQGPLTLLTDHLNRITLAPDADQIDGEVVQISGKVRDPEFQIRSEHGVFTLQKERLKSIEFLNPATPDTAITRSGPVDQSPTLASEQQRPARLLYSD